MSDDMPKTPPQHDPALQVAATEAVADRKSVV